MKTPCLYLAIIAHVTGSCRVFVADRDVKGTEALASELNKNEKLVSVGSVDVTDWNQQAETFSQAVAEFGHIDYVYPIAGVGERTWTPNYPNATGFKKPDLTVLDIDLYGPLYTISLALQQFRRQEPGKIGFRGKSES